MDVHEHNTQQLCLATAQLLHGMEQGSQEQSWAAEEALHCALPLCQLWVFAGLLVGILVLLVRFCLCLGKSRGKPESKKSESSSSKEEKDSEAEEDSDSDEKCKLFGPGATSSRHHTRLPSAK